MTDVPTGADPASAADAAHDVVDGEAVELTPAEQHAEEHAANNDAEVAEAAKALPAAVEQAAQTQEMERHMAQPPTTVLPSPKEWEAAMTMASTIAGTEFVPKGLRGKPDAVLACILAGREIGIGPMQALREISILDGRPVFSAALMLSQLRRGGIRILASESTPERAWIKARRSDTGEEAEVEWTYAEAAAVVSSGGKRLVDKDNWTNYRADMLWARCCGRLARRLGSDLLGGMNYTAEEVADFDDYEGSYATPSAPVKKTPLGKVVVDRRADAPSDIPGLMAMLEAANPAVDWQATVGDIVHAWYGGGYTSVKALPQDERGYFLVRLANFAAILSASLPGDFPPPSDEEMSKALAQAFDGIQSSFTDKPVETPSAEPGREDDVVPSETTEAPEEAVESLLAGLPDVPEDMPAGFDDDFRDNR